MDALLLHCVIPCRSISSNLTDDVGLRVGLMRFSMALLTDVRARNLKPGDSPLPDGSVTGLRLLPAQLKGRGKWQLRYVSPETGKRRDMGLGAYPDTGIAVARKAALQARALLAINLDPLEERARKEAAAIETSKVRATTFEDAVREVYATLQPSWKNAKHRDQWINTLETYVFPVLGSRLVEDLRPSDFAAALSPIWLTKPETASRIKQRCHAVMKWAWGRGLVSGNPVDMVDTLLPKQGSVRGRVQHHPSMPWREIPEFVQAVVRLRKDVTRALLEFVMLTAARSGEARGMIWEEVDLQAKVWTVPAERMKAGSPHRVPLSERAIEILEGQPSGTGAALVFPSPRGLQLTDMALTKFLRDHKAKSDVPGRVATAHGFRSSFRDWASENGYARDLAERALAHTISNQVEAAYHRTDLLEQRREMMQAWADHVGFSGQR
jgi:integrase